MLCEESACVLLVDDDPDFLELFRIVLSSGGWVVAMAADGETALRLVDANGLRPDIVVTDYRMPGLDGLSMIRQLRRKDLLRDVPMVLISGDDLCSAETSPADAFFRKPVEPEALSRVLRRLAVPPR